ncbi:MAG: HWE histidine kinase domain-containing protein [Xanthobacteraceae bacterium]|nr:HWE histidine kinase domain-containing protein [Xanthobacteraceae bacterium]
MFDGASVDPVGRVQAFGFLLAVDAASWWITRASANAAAGLGAPGEILNRPLDTVIAGEAVHALRGALQSDARARLFGLALTAAGPVYDIALHRVGDTVAIECEAAAPDAGHESAQLLAITTRLRQQASEGDLHRAIVREMRALTGFDRVMIHRLGADGSGEVIAESARPGLAPYFGLHFPASDVRRQARAVRQSNRLRVVTDVDAETYPIEPEKVAGGARFDLALSMLRAASPAHVDCLRALGVASVLSMSLARRNALWGLIVCHHPAPHHLDLVRRTSVELIGQIVSLLLETRARDAEAAFEARGRLLQQELVAAMGRDGAGLEGLITRLDGFADLLGSDGIGLRIEGRTVLRGLTPSARQFEDLVEHLRQRAVDTAHACGDIGAEYPPGRAFADRAAGMLVLPLSRPTRDVLVFFRKEAPRTVSWAVDPPRPTVAEDGGREGFEVRRETVRGQSLPWQEMECRVAEALRVVLLDIVLRAVDLTSAERRRAQQRHELLIGELNHRLRNILGLIRGVIAQSRHTEQSVEEFVTVIGGRIQALARAHDQATTDRWGPALFTELVAAEAGAFRDQARDRVVVSGADAEIAPEAFTTIALVLHEMVTNSAKYGALSNPHGRIEIATAFDAAGRFVIVWRERGGPPVRPPRHKGFGSTVIERSIAHDLKGAARLDYAHTGLVAEFVIPAAFAAAAAPTPPRAPVPQAAAEPAFAAPDDVLIVEDNMIIALDAEEMVRALGVASARIAGSVAAALDLIAQRRPDFALLDVNLGGETSFAVAEQLIALEVPFAFASGYGEQEAFPDAVAAVPRLRKPYAAEALRAALAAAGRTVEKNLRAPS